MQNFFREAEYQDHPLRSLKEFLDKERSLEQAKQYTKMRFVGYVLEISFDQATIITSDPFKQAVGGVPRGSYLIMAPDNWSELPPHFTLLRVVGTAPTPLSREVQQTYFELHKKSMPELDIWTQGELQWGALMCKVLGMFYPDPQKTNSLAFSGDVNNVVSAHRYKVFSPGTELLKLIVNGTVRQSHRFPIGKLRLTECQLPFAEIPQPDVEVQVSTDDFKGFRTAMFGKTRLGKSNVVKIIAQSLIETTVEEKNVGQLIFDINGEYANDNPQDDNHSLRSSYPERCVVYALTQREATPSKSLRLNYYEQPGSCMEVIGSLLEQDRQSAQYVRSFASVRLAAVGDISSLPRNQQIRAVRKIQMYWAILQKAGFDADESRLQEIGLRSGTTGDFDPHFSEEIRGKAYGGSPPTHPQNLAQLVNELERIYSWARENRDDAISSSGNRLFDPDDNALLEFLIPAVGGGTRILRPYMTYHSPHAGDFIREILGELDKGMTVILDLGNATDRIRLYFSDMLSRAVFSHQEVKFTSDKLGNTYIQLYFEEAHNLFPKSSDFTDVYARFAKEGAKFHIGIVYCTQSPSTINKELLAQTENFFVAHISSQEEANTLAKLQIAFDGVQDDILNCRTPGYMRMLTFSHRFVIPVQAKKFSPIVARSQEA